MAKSKGTKSKKQNKKQKVKPVIETNNTVIPVSTPVGSVHFDEFLKICRQPKEVTNPVELPKIEKSNKKTKKNNSKKGKNKKVTKKTIVAKPENIPLPPSNEKESTNPELFPLTKALLLQADDSVEEQTPYSEFVVGETEPSVLKRPALTAEVNLVEQQANDTVDKINKVQESIKILMEKHRPTQSETAQLEEQQLLLMNLLSEFEGYLKQIRELFDGERVEDEATSDDWIDIDVDEALEKQRPLKCSTTKKSDKEEPLNTETGKWYENVDLEYLLPSSSSFEGSFSMSSSVLKIIDELQDANAHTRKNAKRDEVFKRLRNKFSILLPPPNLDATVENLTWVDKKLHKDHQVLLNATNQLKLFQCWNQLELKYNIINALIISLKDAVKSTSPFYYANKEVKSQFVTDQCALVQALDDFKRKTNDAFLQAGLADYWKINPESIRLGSRPCFDVTIRQMATDIDDDVPLDHEKLSFSQREPFITKYDNNCHILL